jgi:hypothetical protein
MREFDTGNMVSSQPSQTRLNRAENVIARRANIVRSFAHFESDFGSDDHAFSLTFKRRADKFLRCAVWVAIHVCSIEKINPLIQRAMEDSFYAVFIHFAAELITSNSDGGNFYACFAEIAIFHSGLLIFVIFFRAF